MQKTFFIVSMIFIGSISLLYAGWLYSIMESGKYNFYYIYLRFFLVGWVISSVIIALIGESRSIGGIKSFLISLFNPALGIIMVLASESKTSSSQLTNAINSKNRSEAQKRNNRIKNSSYSLN